LKNKFGKTLLIFPSHSTKTIDANYDERFLCDEVDIISKGSYDTKLVCLYWKDIQLGKHLFYLNRGYKIVCAGYLTDSNFMCRLKSIIKISDGVIGNAIGSYLGYCIFLGKPVYLVKQNHKYKSLRIDSNNELNQRNNFEKESLALIEEKLFHVFSNWSIVITSEQYDLCNYIWGFDKVKNVKELKNMLLS
jgi:hypothetical protein